ncbi:MAG: hypothetical protein ACJ8EL_17085, partial [Rhizomicrobium sp.]
PSSSGAMPARSTINNLRQRGLLKDDCRGSVQHRHLTDQMKSTFFGENDETFMIENFHGEGWLIFDDRQYITKVYNNDNAKRVVTAMKFLRQHEKQQFQNSTSSPMDHPIGCQRGTHRTPLSAVWSLTGGSGLCPDIVNRLSEQRVVKRLGFVLAD